MKINSTVEVHVEIETDMNRTVISYDNLNIIINLIKGTKIYAEGVYIHLSCEDSDFSYTNL